MSTLPLPPPPLGGWTTQQIIELANKRTERRGEKTLDMTAEFIMALHELCMETRWPWRRKTTILTVDTADWKYDLSRDARPLAGDFHQFVQHGVRVYLNAGQPQSWGEVLPVFERGLQDSISYANDSGFSQPGPPKNYFMAPGEFLNMAISPVPDRSYDIQIAYWAIPRVEPDSLPEDIPLLPHYMHSVLLKKLEAQVFRYCLGEGNLKYTAAMNEYNALMAKYQNTMNFTPGEIEGYGQDDYGNQYQISQGDAVQSTS